MVVPLRISLVRFYTSLGPITIDIKCKENLEKIRVPDALRDLVGCSNHWATGDSMASKGKATQPSNDWHISHLGLGFFPIVLLTFNIMLFLFHP